MSETELSRENVLKIVQHYLLSSPPGEFEDILADIREIISDDELLKTGAYEIFHTYNIEQLIPLEYAAGGYSVIVSKYNEIDASHYFDPIGNKILTVDHVSGKIVEDVPNEQINLSDEVRERISTIYEHMKKYASDHYLTGAVSVLPVLENPEKEFVVCISASKYNEKNFWSGRWRSIFKIELDESKKAQVSGSMKVNVHYYENGNVQMNTTRKYADAISAADSETLAKNLVAAIKKEENVFQDSIADRCLSLGETFKTLRKKLPFSKTLFDFNISKQNIVNEMHGGK